MSKYGDKNDRDNLHAETRFAFKEPQVPWHDKGIFAFLKFLVLLPIAGLVGYIFMFGVIPRALDVFLFFNWRKFVPDWIPIF